MIKQVNQAIKAAQAEYLAIPFKAYKGLPGKRRHRNSMRVVSRKLTDSLLAAGMQTAEAHSLVFEMETKFRDEK